MEKASIRLLIQQGEGEQLDFKNRISNAGKIAKTLVAFSNHKGGILLIGVSDNGEIRGVKDEDEERYMLERAATEYCKPAVDIYFEEQVIDDKLILIARIPESSIKPHYALGDDGKWWVYIRIADESILAGKVVVDVLHRDNKEQGVVIQYTEKERELLSYFQTNPKPYLLDLCKHLKLSRRKTQRLLVDLILSGVIAIRHDTQGKEYYVEKHL